MSGIEMRSRLRKRSKINPCWIGSSVVIPSAYEMMLPAADPRPGRRPRRSDGEVDEVADDQKVRRVSHRLDHAELHLEAIGTTWSASG